MLLLLLLLLAWDIHRLLVITGCPLTSVARRCFRWQLQVEDLAHRADLPNVKLVVQCLGGEKRWIMYVKAKERTGLPVSYTKSALERDRHVSLEGRWNQKGFVQLLVARRSEQRFPVKSKPSEERGRVHLQQRKNLKAFEEGGGDGYSLVSRRGFKLLSGS